MRRLATVLLVFSLLVPAFASARPQGSAECRYLSNQIEFFETRVARAEQMGNDVWEQRLGSHLAGLEDRRDDRCPGYGDSEEAWQALDRLIELAAKGAVTFFTMGAF